MQNLTDKELNDKLAYWKELLGLQDWTIAISICRGSDMILEGVEGETEYCHLLKTAVIRILDVIDYGDRIIEQDQEKTIIHELLHCLFSAIDTDDVILDRLHHQMIETIAKALVVSAKRDK